MPKPVTLIQRELGNGRSTKGPSIQIANPYKNLAVVMIGVLDMLYGVLLKINMPII